MDAQLLEILACPDAHHAPLRHDSVGQTLTCTECGRIFPIRDGIPVLLLDEAEPPESAESGQTDEEPGNDQPGSQPAAADPS